MSTPASPSVSVVMPVLNPHSVYFPEAVASVLGQTFADLELIVVEAAGEQSAAPLLAKFTDARLRHLVLPQPTTLVAQRNRGLAEARAELVAMMDADDVSEPFRLEKQVRLLRERPDLDVLGSQLQIIDEHGKCRGYRWYPLDHAAICRTMPRWNPLAQPAVLFRKATILAAGGYQYDRHPAVEDYELWSRLARRGTRFANHPQPLLRYRIHPGGMKTSKLRGILRGTLAVKRMHWGEGMGTGDRLRVWGERLLLRLPPSIVLWGFEKLCYRSRPAAFTNDCANESASERQQQRPCESRST